jgi:polyribonucleotide nucleotidyltransferase
LTDIAGAEDHYGDMDFKVAGTKAGITALQMDIKVPNVTGAIMKEALEQARVARLFILDRMNSAIDTPRATLSPYAPRIFTMHIPTDKIRELIGPGGKGDSWNRRADRLQDRCGRRRQREDLLLRRGRGRPLHPHGGRDLRRWPKSARRISGKVVRIVDFGAFVEIFPGTDGLLHISEISENRIKQVRDELKEGDQILVKVLASKATRSSSAAGRS